MVRCSTSSASLCVVGGGTILVYAVRKRGYLPGDKGTRSQMVEGGEFSRVVGNPRRGRKRE